MLFNPQMLFFFFKVPTSALPLSSKCDWSLDIQSAHWSLEESHIMWVSVDIRVPHADMSEQGLCFVAARLFSMPFLVYWNLLVFLIPSLFFQFGLSLLYALLSQGEKLLSSGVPLEPSIGDFEMWWEPQTRRMPWTLTRLALFVVSAVIA